MTSAHEFCAYIRSVINTINKINNISKHDYVDLNDNTWMIYSYTHPHCGGDVYDTGEKATDNDIFIERVKRTLIACMVSTAGAVPFECSIDGVIAAINHRYDNRPRESIKSVCEYLSTLKFIPYDDY